MRWVFVAVGALLTVCLACVDRETREATGAELYTVHCASCHGPEGAGDGPVAAGLATAPSDLRTIAARNGGTFDEAAVLAVIDGRRQVAVHGPRDMPVWGTILTEEKRGEPMPVYRAMGDARALVDYLRTLQQPPAGS
jgi:mono/diheme cytochrome c family protein